MEYGNQVHTGKDNISLIGQFIEWNGNFKIYEHGGWGSKAAKMINGTAGFIFPPGVKKDHNLTAFITELYRYVCIVCLAPIPDSRDFIGGMTVLSPCFISVCLCMYALPAECLW